MTEFDVIQNDFDLLFDLLKGVLFVLKCLLTLSFINLVLICVAIFYFI